MNEIINFVVFSIAGAPVTLIDLVTSVIGLTCVFLAGRNNKYNFYIGYFYTFALFIMFWNKNLYASLILQPISLGINILGHYRWTHPRQGEKSAADDGALKVTMLTWPERVLALVSVFTLAKVWGWLLAMLGNKWFVGMFPPDPIPYLDACVTVLILVAQLLAALKKLDCWVAWLLVNITQMILHISVGHVFMPVVCGLYLINGIISIWHWTRLYKRSE